MDFISKEFIFQKSPQELTALLYEACLTHLESAIEHIEAKRMAEANDDLQKVNDIVERLGGGLNYEAGAIANQLDTLYNYVANQVVMGNLKKDTSMLKEVLHIVEQLSSAWNEAMKTGETTSQRQRQQKAQAYEKNVTVLNED